MRNKISSNLLGALIAVTFYTALATAVISLFVGTTIYNTTDIRTLHYFGYDVFVNQIKSFSIGRTASKAKIDFDYYDNNLIKKDRIIEKNTNLLTYAPITVNRSTFVPVEYYENNKHVHGYIITDGQWSNKHRANNPKNTNITSESPYLTDSSEEYEKFVSDIDEYFIRAANIKLGSIVLINDVASAEQRAVKDGLFIIDRLAEENEVLAIPKEDLVEFKRLRNIYTQNVEQQFFQSNINYDIIVDGHYKHPFLINIFEGFWKRVIVSLILIYLLIRSIRRHFARPKCSECGSRNSLPLDSHTLFVGYEHQTTSGKPDMRFKNNHKIFETREDMECVKCGNEYQVVTEHLEEI